MRNSLLTSDDLKKTNSSHFKRYSEHDLKTSSINSLLITQANAFSHLKFKSLKTKLPQITSTTQAFSNSHFKVNKINDAVSELGSEIQQLSSDLQEIRVNFENQKESLEDKYEKTNSGLGSKVQRLSKMLDFTVTENKKRSQKINSGSLLLREGTEDLKGKVDEIRRRVKLIEDELGVYTGEDKYLQ